MSREQLRLAHLTADLEPDAQLVLVKIAERLLVGQKQYGCLSIDTDRRDWGQQANEEFLDGAVYLAIKTIRGERVGQLRRTPWIVRVWRRFAWLFGRG